MRIIHVSDCYAPRTGGIESQVRDLARAQAAAGDDVHVLTATRGPHGHGGPPEDDGGVRVHRMGTSLPADLPVNPAAPPHVRALLRRLRPDVVHVHAGVVSPFAFDGARVAVGEGLPVAVTWHCMLDGLVPALRFAVRRTAWRDAPVALSAVSGQAAERVREVFGRVVEVVPDGVDLDGWRPTDAAAPLDGPLRCVATMRLAPRKRGVPLVHVVADAAGQLDPGGLVVDVLGDGPEGAAMQRAVRRRDAADVVRLVGRVPREQLAQRYADAHVFLAPARLEAFGIAALEARACGLVVLGRRGTGLSEFVTDGTDGLLVDDDAAMARALVRLARDRELLGRLRGAARSVPPRLGWARTAEAAASEYRRARRMRGLAEDIPA